MKALIIDDHEPSRTALARVLLRLWTIDIEPLEVLEAGTLAEGIALAPQANVTIMDLDMPGSTMEEVIESIDKFEPPVIVQTAHAEMATRCLEARASHVHIKGGLCGMEPLLSSVFAAMRRDLLRRHNIDSLSAPEPHQPERRHG